MRKIIHKLPFQTTQLLPHDKKPLVSVPTIFVILSSALVTGFIHGYPVCRTVPPRRCGKK